MKKMTVDGNTAASHIAYAFSEVAAIYPITPSSNMAEYADEWAATGRKNMFGQVLKIAELQSEAGAAGAVHGSLASGALTTTYTASQGLLLMIPNMYKISGEMLPTVFHVSARALAAHALSIFGDHADVMACRQTGFAMLSSNSVQEALDMALVAHLSTLKSRVPFVHFFDGFRTSHEVSKIEGIEYEDILPLVDMADIKDFRKRALNPEHPHQKGTAQNPDIYFQNREAANKYYDATPAIVKTMMDKVFKLTGRRYELFQYYGAPDAEEIIIMMGSGCEAAEETINYLNKNGKKVGLLKVRLYRPFSVKDFIGAIPASVKKIAVLDRTKEPGSIGEPLYMDVCSALLESGRTNIKVVGGRYGLGSKEFTPSHINAVYENLWAANPKTRFTVGIVDDVTNLSLPVTKVIDASPEGTIRCKFYGIGGDGTVGANQNSIRIIGDHTDKYAQGYFVYDSKKSGGITVSHLRFGNSPIKSTYLIDQADFVACHNQSYVTRYDMISDIKEGGTFLLNCLWDTAQLEKELPAQMKQAIAKKKLKFYTIDALSIARGVGMKQINSVMQATFFKLADVIPYAQADGYMKEAVVESYGKKGEKVVKMNFDAIDNAIAGLKEVSYPASWATATDGAVMMDSSKDEYYQKFIKPIFFLNGNSLPVSTFNADGTVPTSTTQFEKRGVAAFVPEWLPENCIQCNICSFVCPHATIRPFLLDGAAKKKAPKGFTTIASKPDILGYEYRIQVSPQDCMGCGSCANVCPAKVKALQMVPFAEGAKKETENWDYAVKLPVADVSAKSNKNTVKGSQFLQPLFEFSGACAGCGETPYVKLATQLFGDRMIIGNATGCSSIYGGSAPTCPYTVNDKGHGPAWANSLFEDTAEFSYGFVLAYSQRVKKLVMNAEKALSLGADGALKTALADWLKNYEDAEGSKKAGAAVKAALPAALKSAKGALKDVLTEISESQDCLVKKSLWAFGGDGWAYDIGFGGLDHVLASGEDINMLVMDTEVYSNTGGQASKATPTGSTAKFAYAGMRTVKKDLGAMMMSYGNVYVAQICVGADNAQVVKAFAEAESYKGPSVIIAYATCINHGFDMSKGVAQGKKAVEAGYWPLYRFDPRLAAQGKNPFQLDSKDPTGSYREFIESETRYTSLKKMDAATAETLFERAEQEAKAKLEAYKHKAKQ
ncbi:MAG: pyruvate:ferredoxin (flavodoxin) oxidoreductase [Firmicutes bacterium]|nr:pyruvate:ferredoxin (flavodoxin) oxidoreductase [Bacillota bacterium]